MHVLGGDNMTNEKKEKKKKMGGGGEACPCEKPTTSHTNQNLQCSDYCL